MQTSKQKQTTAHFWSLRSSSWTEGPRRSWERQCVWSQRQWRLALWTLKKRPDSGTVPQKKEEGSGNGRRVFLVGKKHGTRAGGGFTACHAFITHDTAFKWRLSQYLQHHTKVRYTPHIFIFLSRSLTSTVSFKGAVTFVRYCIYHTYIYVLCVHYSLASVVLWKRRILTFHPSGVCRVRYPFGQSIFLSDDWIFFRKYTENRRGKDVKTTTWFAPTQ